MPRQHHHRQHADLAQAHFATGIATRLQQVLDDWNFLSPQLQDLFVALNQGKARHAFAFEPRLCMAPLPRACLHAHAAPALQLCASDALLGPRQDAWCGAASWGIGCNAALAAITGDVAQGASAEQGQDGVRLLMLANTWRLRAPPGDAVSAPAHQPCAAFGPVAVTPDELGDAWCGGRAHGALQMVINSRALAPIDSSAQLRLQLGALVAALSATRPLRAGSIVSASAPGSTDDAAPPARLAMGDVVRLTWTGQASHSSHNSHDVFGSIEQRVTGPQAADTTDLPARNPADAGSS